MIPEALAFIGTSDLSGLLRGKSIPLGTLERRMGRGVGIAPSNLLMSAFGPIGSTPFGTAGEVMLVPDASTRAELPMAGGPDAALLLGDFLTTDGQPWPYCPRGLLRRGLAGLAAAGFGLLAAFEQELVYTGIEDRPGAPYTMDALRRQGAFGGTLLAALRAAGLEPESFLAEYAPRQFEVTVGPRPGLRAADEAVLVREMARAWAGRLGHRAILAPMPRADGVGSGTHIHWSLLDPAGHPATYDPARPHGLSDAAEHFTAGLLHHLPAMAAVTAPSVASYYRLRPDKWAPVTIDLGAEDRGSAVRVCPVYAGSEHGAARQFNVEYRVADACACPYLALGVMVHAGLDGLRRGLRLADLRPASLPTSLPAALDLFEASEAARSWFGDGFHALYARFKRDEVAMLAGLDEQAVCDRYAAVY